MTSAPANTPKKWRRDWLAWLLAGTVLYGLICLISLASDVGRPFPGFLTYHNFILARIDIFRNTPAWWWSGVSGYPAITDVIQEVAGVPFTNLTAPLNEGVIYENAWRQEQRSVQTIVWRSGQFLTLETPLLLFTWRRFLDLMLAPAIIALILWLLALSRKPVGF